VFGLGPATRIYVALGATDLRKGFDGLYGIVRDRLGLEVRSGHLFLFANARRNRLKILYWDGSGLWSCAKANAPHCPQAVSYEFFIHITLYPNKFWKCLVLLVVSEI